MKNLALVLLLLCSGCAGIQQARECQKEIGPAPYEWANAFGLVGAIAAGATEERQEHDQKMHDCMEAKRAAASQPSS